jgi:hypothetical protein
MKILSIFAVFLCFFCAIFKLFFSIFSRVIFFKSQMSHSLETAELLWLGVWIIIYPMIKLPMASWQRYFLATLGCGYYILFPLIIKTDIFFVDFLLCSAGCIYLYLIDN